MQYRAPESLLGCHKYTAAVDIWAAGCIFVEMFQQGKVVFDGDSLIDQIFKIFKVLGTPKDGPLTKLPEFKSNFPQWLPVSLSSLFPEIEPEGIDLLTVKQADYMIRNCGIMITRRGFRREMLLSIHILTMCVSNNKAHYTTTWSKLEKIIPGPLKSFSQASHAY